MKKDYMGSTHTKKALALAVSCWLLCGGMAQAKDIYGQGDASNTGDISGVNVTLNQDITDANYSNTFNLAYTQKGTAANNKLVINGGTYSVSGDGKYANWFYGGNTDDGAAINNSIVINDGNFVNSSQTNQAAGIYSAFARGGYAATNNSVTINGGNFGGYTYASAAVAASGDANNNTTTVNGGNFERGVYLFGGRANNTGNTNGNTVNVTNGTIGGYRAFAWGGKADSGNAVGNTVNISGGVIADSVADPNDNLYDNLTYAEYAQGAAEIYGGYTLNGTAADNIVNISGGTISSNGECVVYGGYSRVGNATGNTVNITGGSTQKRLTVFGGFATSGNATGNTVIVTGGNAQGLVYLNGGVTMSSTGNATGNTVAIYAPVPLTVADGGIYLTGSKSSGFTWNSTNSGDLKTGNKLIVGAYGISAQNIYNFETWAFRVPATASSGTMVTLTDGTIGGGLADTKIELTADGGAALSTGQTIQLVSSNSALNYNGATTGTLRQGVTLNYDYTLNNSTNSLSATLGQATVNSETKSLVETRDAQSAFINRGADLLITQGLEQADHAAKMERGSWSPFFATQVGKNRYNTGSYVDNSGWSSILGMAKNYGSLLAGVAVEYGNGKYDSYMDSMHGKGDTKYTGVALFARKAAARGLYYEGSIRYGQTKADYTSSDFTGYEGTAVHYDTDSNYWGAHLGIGKVIPVSKTDTIDVSLRYLYSHNGSDNVQLSTGESYAFDAVTSHRLRTGFRWTRQFNEANAMYAGMAYQYEFNGDARASYRGFELASPSLKGSSGMLELGYRVKPSTELPLTLDLNVTGWVGEQKGVTGQIGFTYNF